MPKLFDFVITSAMVCGILSFGVLLSTGGLAIFFAVAAPGFWLDVFAAAAVAAFGLFISAFGVVFLMVISARLFWAEIDRIV